MFWSGFWCGVIAVLIIMSLIITGIMIFAYGTAPTIDEEEQKE